MRADQFESLLARREKLLDAFLTESDPETWPGAGKADAEMTKDERGDRFWCKRSCAATLSIALRISSLIDSERRSAREWNTDPAEGGPPLVTEEEDIEADIERYEQQARSVLNKLKHRDG